MMELFKTFLIFNIIIKSFTQNTIEFVYKNEKKMYLIIIRIYEQTTIKA